MLTGDIARKTSAVEEKSGILCQISTRKVTFLDGSVSNIAE